MDNNSIVIDWKNIADPVLREKERKKTWAEANKEKRKLQFKIWYAANQDKIKNYRQINKEKISLKNKNWAEVNKQKRKVYNQIWSKANSKKINLYKKNKRSIDVQYKLRSCLRSRFKSAIKMNCKTGNAISDLGCSINELKIYLESKFQEGMSWDNWKSNGWHIDHIKPLASFDLTDRNQLLQACHYTNLQPLWAKDNIAKSDKIL